MKIKARKLPRRLSAQALGSSTIRAIRSNLRPSQLKTSALLALCGFALAVSCASAQSAGAAGTAGTAAAPVAASTAVAEAQRVGTVKSVRGDVKLQSGEAPARTAGAGDAVAGIDRIRTGPDSGASVVMRDGTAIVVGPSSQMDMKEFRFDATTQDGSLLVSLLRGSLRMITGAIGKTHPEAIRVETPTAVIGIRGTDFIVEADPKP